MLRLLAGAVLLGILAAPAGAGVVQRFCDCAASRCAGGLPYSEARAICEDQLGDIDFALFLCRLAASQGKSVPACRRLRSQVRRSLRDCRRGRLC
jgi:hypothetical protein